MNLKLYWFNFWFVKDALCSFLVYACLEDLVDSIFHNCNTDQTGWVPVSRLLNYITCIIEAEGHVSRLSKCCITVECCLRVTHIDTRRHLVFLIIPQ